ncbi:hypothetical protein LguiA_013684 [Lonicera macranthoides]
MNRDIPPKSFPNTRRGSVPANFRSVRQPYQTSFRRGRPPGPPPGSFNHYCPNFTIELLSYDKNECVTKAHVHCLISKLKCKPDNFNVYEDGLNVGRLFFQQWPEALETLVELWENRLNGVHMLSPMLIHNLLVPSDIEDVKDRLKKLFVEHVKRLIEGDLVKKWEKKLGIVSSEVQKVKLMLAKPNSVIGCNELLAKKRGLLSEEDLIKGRLKEYESAMKCILSHLEGKQLEDDEEVKVFRFGRDFDWVRIHFLMMRECRRLDNGLPIYAFRRDILRQIHRQQIMVLIGETGSGKSTQLVQFLADSKVAGGESIICTQPRKLAAISLTQRVKEESYGCHQDTPIICYPTYSSVQSYDSKVIYMTDHCLLQYYMSDKNLSKISCIIVDEAHERSLNTDLLLAVLKKLLHQRRDLRLIIMSATANANQLSDYFFGCETFHVVGRTFPVDTKYAPCALEGPSASDIVASYVSDVVRMVTEIHRMESEGTILAFLTSQMEVEWACEKFQAPYAVALPLHGKLSHDEQLRVFHSYPGKRKVIFTTNLAETSLTIPGVKYVVDCGMVKESRFEPGTGMSVLRVCRISQSSAEQRAGRAGRTEPGKCYRLYSEHDFELMLPHPEPEIRKVHLGVAVLRILALGSNDMQNFDFVDAPSAKAIEMAIRNLVQLGAVTHKNDAYRLTKDGWDLVRLGIEPRLGKIILSCFQRRLGREGLVLAAVMANASSIFCRVGTEEDKRKSDRFKVQFCHHNGELFTLLSVYKKWEGVPCDKKNKWCWDNSINAKSMRRCQEMVQELEFCLQNELRVIIPSYWLWNPEVHTEHDNTLKNVILSSLAENVAMYSGYDQLGYEVALTGNHVQLHPSCSLLNFSERPSWVVFGEILSVSKEYLVCVTAINVECLYSLCPPLFDVPKMESRKLQLRVLTGFGSTLLKKLCGKSNNGLLHLVSRARTAFEDERIGVEVNVDRNEILLFASSQDIERVCSLVNDALEHERKWLENECLEKCLYHGGRGVSPPIALFGAGAEIKHLELKNRYLTVDVSHSDVSAIEDKELLMFLERSTSGCICGVHKLIGVPQEGEEKEKWGRITFHSPDAAKKATDKLNQVEFNGASLKVTPSKSTYGSDHKLFSFPAVKAKLYWPRKFSKGVAFVKCAKQDVASVVNDFSTVLIGGKFVRCEPSVKSMDSVVIGGLDRELSEAEIFEVLRTATDKTILDFFLVRGNAVENPPCDDLEEALLKEISAFMPKRNLHRNYVRIQVFPPEPRDNFVRASITFDGSLHLEAAKALEQLEGKVLPRCLSWQKIKCQQLFHSYVSCPSPVYSVIKEQLDSLLGRLRHRKGAECNLDQNENGSYRVKISANATKTVAELRRPLEQLMKGKTIEHAGLTPTVLQFLFSRDGINLMKSIQKETGTHIFFDRHNLNVRIFGSSDNTDVAQQRLVQSLLTMHQSKQLEVHLRGGDFPPDLMKRVVARFGPDLHGLKNEVPEAEFSLNTKYHVISIHGSKQLKQKVEDIIYEIAQTSGPSKGVEDEAACPICLCEVEDSYRLEGCTHEFCRSCLAEQCDSALKSRDSFPMCCAQKDCGAPILLTDLRSLLSSEKLEELFRASLGAFVAASGGTYRFCPSPDCPSVYEVEGEGSSGAPFVCGACFVETCTRCHLEYHPYLSCEKYREFKEDPDSSLKEWCEGKDNVKHCPVCGFTIEKYEGCNHVECRCGRHICWVCLEFFATSDDCYGHLRSVHLAII